MTRLTVQVRTADNLLDLLKATQSGNWVVAQGKEQDITHVEIVNFEGTQKIEGTFEPEKSGVAESIYEAQILPSP